MYICERETKKAARERKKHTLFSLIRVIMLMFLLLSFLSSFPFILISGLGFSLENFPISDVALLWLLILLLFLVLRSKMTTFLAVCFCFVFFSYIFLFKDGKFSVIIQFLHTLGKDILLRKGLSFFLEITMYNLLFLKGIFFVCV